MQDRKSRLVTLALFLAVYSSSQAHALKASDFELSVGGLYLQPSTSNMEYAVLTSPLPLLTPNWEDQAVQPGYSPAFMIGLRYVFADPLYDIRAEWTELNTSDSDSVTASNTQFVGAPYETGPDGTTIRAASSTGEFNFNNVNMTIGRVFNVHSDVAMRVFSGINVAAIKEELSTTFSGNGLQPDPLNPVNLSPVDSGGAFSVSSTNLSRFTGAGPRLGLDSRYFFNKHFAVLLEMAGSVLLGNIETSTDYASSSGVLSTAGIAVNRQRLSAENRMGVVPEVDGKLGVLYTVALHKLDSTLSIEAGYTLSSYLNALEQVNPLSLATPLQPGTIAVATDAQTVSDFSMNGPYLTASWRF